MPDQLEVALAQFLQERGAPNLSAYLQISLEASIDIRDQALRVRRDWAQAQRNNSKFQAECAWLIKHYRALREVFVFQPEVYRGMVERSAVTQHGQHGQQVSGMHEESLRRGSDSAEVDTTPASASASVLIRRPLTQARRLMRAVGVRGHIPPILLEGLMQMGAASNLSEEQMALLLEDEERWWVRLEGRDAEDDRSVPRLVG